jgi:hypothetical protein
MGRRIGQDLLQSYSVAHGRRLMHNKLKHAVKLHRSLTRGDVLLDLSMFVSDTYAFLTNAYLS